MKSVAKIVQLEGDKNECDNIPILPGWILESKKSTMDKIILSALSYFGDRSEMLNNPIYTLFIYQGK